MAASSSDHDSGRAKGRSHDLGRAAVRAPVFAVAIGVAAVVAISSVIWAVAKSLRGRPAAPGTEPGSAEPETPDWRNRARAATQRCREALRDFDPTIVSADGSKDSRDMRASWLERAIASAREIRGPLAGLRSSATTSRGGAVAGELLSGIDRVTEAATELLDHMDDAGRVKRLADEHARAEQAVRALGQMF
jgi:hypothetical protein